MVQMQDGIGNMRDVLEGRAPARDGLTHGTIGDLAAMLDDFDVSLCSGILKLTDEFVYA